MSVRALREAAGFGSEPLSAYVGMGTVVSVRAFGPCAEAALMASQAETARLEALMSRFRFDSDIGRLNRRAGYGVVPLCPETAEVLALAAQVSVASRGAFDITIPPLLDLWRAAAEVGELPAPARIAEALPLVNHRGLKLSPHPPAFAGLPHPDQAVDLGGIGKGYAGDRLRDVLRHAGTSSAFASLGGVSVALGSRPDGSPWRVGVQHPRRGEGDLIANVLVHDKAVVTSGDYERYFIGPDGARYHHIIDPETGYPAASGLASVTVVCESAALADALSTALLVLGMGPGLELLGCPHGLVGPADAVFVGTDGLVTITEGLVGSFEALRGVPYRVA